MFHPPALPAVPSSKLGSINKLADAEKAEMRQTSAETPPKRNARFNVTVCMILLPPFPVTLISPKTSIRSGFSQSYSYKIRTDNAIVFFYYIIEIRSFAKLVVNQSNTAYASVILMVIVTLGAAREAVRLGVFDCLDKPFNVIYLG